MKAIEYSKEAARQEYPEIFGDNSNYPNEVQEAYNAFDNIDETTDEFKEAFENAFKDGGEGWCDIISTESGNIAVFSESPLTTSDPIYVIKLHEKLFYGYIYDDDTFAVIATPSSIIDENPSFNFRYIQANRNKFDLVVEVTEKEIEQIQAAGYAFNVCNSIDIDFASFEAKWDELYG